MKIFTTILLNYKKKENLRGNPSNASGSIKKSLNFFISLKSLYFSNNLFLNLNLYKITKLPLFCSCHLSLATNLVPASWSGGKFTGALSTRCVREWVCPHANRSICSNTKWTSFIIGKIGVFLVLLKSTKIIKIKKFKK